MKKILITGASGFVGTNLLAYLAKHTEFKLEPISLRQGVPTKIEDSVFAIIHLAGKAHDLKNASNEAEYFQVNTELTKELFQVFLESKASIFIFLSSVKAVADTVDGVLTEDAIPNPVTVYGKSKLEAERYILSQKVPDWKKVFILRPCMIHGPGNKGNLNLLYNIVSKGIPWPLGAFENHRSFCSVENLCFVINELVNRSYIASGVYQISDDDPLSTIELIEIISESVYKRKRIWKLPKQIIYMIAAVGNKLGSPLNSDSLQKLTDSFVVANQKIKESIKTPLPVSTREGLKHTFKSFLK